MPSKHSTLTSRFSLGPVSFSITATTSGNPSVLSMPPSTMRKRGLRQRGLFDKIKQVAQDAGDKVKEVAAPVTSVAAKAADAVTSVAVQAESKATSVAVLAESKVTSAAVAAATKVAEETKFDKNEKSTPPPVDINTKFNVFNSSLDCGDKGKLALTVDSTTVAHANVTFGLVTAGTLVPPKFDTFSFTGGISAEFNGTLHWKGAGNVSTRSCIHSYQGADNLCTGGQY
jgi:hypothetical protein